MLQFKQFILAFLLVASAVCAKADRLWIIGEATPSGWDTDRATALLSEGDSKEFSGTIYLKAGQDFKFMTVPDWGNEEYGSAPGASLVDGEIALSKGTVDNGYGKLQVAEDANYHIVVNTDALTARIEKSVYQDSEITMSSLSLVGGATAGGWDVMKGTPLYQSKELPYEFESGETRLNEGSFKIAIFLKGACSWNPEFWYFRDAADDKKIARGQDGDVQWNIEENDTYSVRVNVIENSISLTPDTTSFVSSVADDCNETPEYYTLTGVRVNNPGAGIYICKRGTTIGKVVVK